MVFQSIIFTCNVSTNCSANGPFLCEIYLKFFEYGEAGPGTAALIFARFYKPKHKSWSRIKGAGAGPHDMAFTEPELSEKCQKEQHLF
jgi:hypothetical protein